MRTLLALALVGLTLLGSITASAIAPANSIGLEPGILREVCYDHYGCFSTEFPWTSLIRPSSALPNPPYEVGTRFLLFTRSNSVEDVELMPDNEFILNFSPYGGAKKTIVLIHGFTGSVQSEWLVDTKNALLQKEDVNIIAVDWSPGASSNYLKATANARLCGAQVTRFLNFLVNKGNLNLDDLRVVAHSLGAHVAGYAGERLGGRIGHITALDASEPYFGGADPIVRLDPTDAQHVHAVYTDGNTLLRIGMGMLSNVGHVNVYPNGGKGQPGCSGNLGSLITSIFDIIFLNFDDLPTTWACSHNRAANYYAESIASQCPFVAFKCDSYSSFTSGRCVSSCNGANSCTVVGYGSERTRATASGDFYLDTTNGGPFCLQTLRYDSPVAQSQSKTTGKVTVTFRHADGRVSEKFTIADGSISNGQILNQWLHVPGSIFKSAGEKPSLIIRYTRGGLLPTTQPRYLALDSISIYMINENLQLELVTYPGTTLETGVDFIVN